MSAVTGSAESRRMLEIKQESDDSSDGEKRLVLYNDNEVIESKEELKENFTKLINYQSNGQSPIKYMTTDAKPHQCTECPAKFILEQDLKNHITCHASPSQHTCVICRENFRDSSSLNIHVLALHKLMHRCHICMEGFSHKGPYLVHMRIHRSGKSQQRIQNEKMSSEFKCEICQKTLPKQEEEKHRKSHVLEQADKSTHDNIELQNDSETCEYLNTSKRKRKIGEVEQESCILDENFSDNRQIKYMENLVSEASDLGQSHYLKYKNREEQGEITQPVLQVESVLDNSKMEPNMSDNLEMEAKILDNIKIEPHVSDNIEMQPNMSDNIEMQPNMPDNIKIEPNMSENIEMQPNMSDNIKFEAHVSDNIEVQPIMSENIAMQPNMSDNTEMQPNMSDNFEMQPNELENFKIEPRVSENIELQPNMSNNIEMQPNIMDDIKIEPHVSDNIEMEPIMSENIAMQPNMSDNFEMQPNVFENFNIEPHVSENIELQPNMSDNTEMQPNILDNIKIEPHVSDNIEMQPVMSENIAMQPNMSDNFEMQPNVLENFNIEPHVSENIELQPNMSDNTEMQPNILDNIKIEPHVSDNIEMQPNISDNIEMQPNMSDNNEMQQTILDNIKIEPNVSNNVEMQPNISDNIEMQPNMSDNFEMKPDIFGNIKVEPKIVDQCVDVTPSSQNHLELSRVFLISWQNHLEMSPLVIPKTKEKLNNEMEKETLQDSLIPKQNGAETSDNFRHQASEFLKRKVTKFELEDLRKYKYLCEDCGQSFSRMSNLNRHKRSHVSRNIWRTSEPDYDTVNGNEKVVCVSYNIRPEPNVFDNTRLKSNTGDQCVDVTKASKNNPELWSVDSMGRENHLGLSPLVIVKPEVKLDNEMEAKTLQDSWIPKQNEDKTSDKFRNQASNFLKRKVTNRDSVFSCENFEMDDLDKYKYLCDKCGQTFSGLNYLNLHMRSHRKARWTLESDDNKIHGNGISEHSDDNQEIINKILREKNPQVGVQSCSITSSDSFHSNDCPCVSDIAAEGINSQNTYEEKCLDEHEHKNTTSISTLCSATSRPSSVELFSPNTSAKTRPTAPLGSDTSCQTKSTVDSINLNGNNDKCFDGNILYDGQCIKGETKNSNIIPPITSSRNCAEQNIMQVEGKSMFDCPSCHAKLDSEEMFESHMKLHNNEIRYYRFRCDVCNISFGRSSTLIRHRKLHCYKNLQTKPY